MIGVLANIGAKANEVNAVSYTLASVGDVEDSDLLTAFADANDGSGTNVVKLQMSFAIDSSFAFPSKFNVVLDFNEYRITVPEETNHVIYNCGTVVLQDTSRLGKGGITIENGQWIYNYGNLTFESGHYLSTSWKSGGILDNLPATINGGHLDSNYRVIFNRSDLLIQEHLKLEMKSILTGQNIQEVKHSILYMLLQKEQKLDQLSQLMVEYLL